MLTWSVEGEGSNFVKWEAGRTGDMLFVNSMCFCTAVVSLESRVAFKILSL